MRDCCTLPYLLKHTVYLFAMQGPLLALTREAYKIAKHVLGEILLSYYVVDLPKVEYEENPDYSSQATFGALAKKNSGKLVVQCDA